MKEIILEAQKRDIQTRGKLKSARKQGLIPAIVYGNREKSDALFINEKDVTKLLKTEAGSNVLINLKYDSKSKTVLIKEIQKHVVSQKIIHLDFQVISLEKEIEVSIPVKLSGESSGVKNQGGILESILREIKVKCLPKNIPQSIEIDVSNLNLGDQITVKDLKLPEKVTAVTEPNAIVVHVVAPTKVEEVTPGVVAAAAVPAEPEVILKGKKEVPPEEAEAAAAPAKTPGTKPAEPAKTADAKMPETKPEKK
ncbi:MAG: 50S ribosomal protein L25/general stress protein Ctc [Elusimicrobiota bacterium]